MFITFKSAQHKSAQHKSATGAGVEPLSAGKAGSARSRPSRSSACESCSSKKVRCTRNRPSCARCVARNLTCIYANKEPRHDSQRSASPTLEDSSEGASDPSATSQHPSLQPSLDSTSVPESLSSGGQESAGHQHQDVSSEKGTTLSCSCLESLMDVVQKLDDDFFHLRLLPFDEVLHVQKWLMFTCCQPLDCENCAEKSTIHSTLLIICDRISQIFACLCGRLNKISTGTMDLEDLPPLVSWSAQPVRHEQIASQLFDGQTGQSGKDGSCTVDIFRERFGAEHSHEEQFLTIHVLMKAQMRNFTKLLDRVSNMRQCRESLARTGRVQNLKTFVAHLDDVLDKIVSDHNAASS